ncbi:MAG: hypothetical protein ACRD41_14435, partial [Candidatus Acidiferrales bacterium]
ALLALDRVDDARSELQLAEREMEQVPASALGALPNASVLQAEILLHAHNFPAADASLKSTEERIRAMSGPDSWSEALFDLQFIARTARENGDWDLCEFTAKQMIDHDPTYAGGYYELALAEEHRGNTAAAKTQFQMAGKLWSHADSDLPEVKEVREKLSASQ